MFGGSLAGNVSSCSLSSSRSCSHFVFSWRVSFGTARPPFRWADQSYAPPLGRHMTLSNLVAEIPGDSRSRIDRMPRILPSGTGMLPQSSTQESSAVAHLNLKL
jgi:hypothetical protein